MSFPTIPDINPEITIKREDAINLLLVSIALEEISLSDLIDAEVKKICCVVKDCENTHSVNDIKDINRSVDQTLKDIIKLQMLLQFKLENIQEITSSSTTTSTTTTTTHTTTTTTTHTTTTTTTHTTTNSTSTTTSTKTTTTMTNSTTSTKTTTTKKKCKCCLTSSAKGCVSKKCDPFSCGRANIKISVCKNCCCKLNNLISYCVNKSDETESIQAFPDSIKIKCHSIRDPYTIKIKGRCSIVRKTCLQHDITDTGSFELMIWNTFYLKRFRMVITADNNPILNHDSGKINIKDFSLFAWK